LIHTTIDEHGVRRCEGFKSHELIIAWRAK